MVKITYLGAGSAAFVKNILGDVMLTPALSGAEIALYDINRERLDESLQLVEAMKESLNSQVIIRSYVGPENRRKALQGADFVINTIQVGGYDPSTIIDFEIPKKYGLYQTIGDTLGIGGIFRTLRTIPVLRDFAEDVEAVCPDAWFLNYTNPMAMLAGYLQRYTRVKTVGLCHSVQVCSERLLSYLDIKTDGFVDKIAGINHMAWLLEIRDKDGNDLYPLIREKVLDPDAGRRDNDLVRMEYIRRLGYYCTESSEHNAEYNPFFIKPNYPQLIDRYIIPLDDYPRRCIELIESWEKQKKELMNDGKVTHTRSREYASRIMEAMVSNTPYKINGNVLNHGLITNLPQNACVEIPCLVTRNGIDPVYVGDLPPQLAAMNMTNINVQLLTIEAAVTKKKEHVYHAAMLDPHTASVLSLDDIVSMCDELIAAHNETSFKVLI